ncbi:hypothetical protein GYMLUDRAFT_75054 [Collybiopsis luxurians FD-317 M1]|uniref:DUF7143 domain-containing protein n=1 Tax=Collybiopsis luxurians FD-317 M1 TaxID=944289 RepID=A0A0D0CRP6_9AGAR|nr:hypothetical protein GYMLUDRAFT_75054 [Collybiopsis luxurians FD-317 M1]
MMYSVSVLLATAALFSSGFSAPVIKRANPCFVTGSVALPAEVSDGLAALEAAPVTCNNAVQVAPGVPDVTSGGIVYSSIDFQKSSLSPVGFALQTFTTPADPADADLTTLQNQLNDYLALEAGVRSQPNSSALLAKLKGPKFFLQFQIGRVNTANGVQLDVADTVDHQLTKVLNNAVGATPDELAQVKALATQV